MIEFRGRQLQLLEGETVLECLERSGERIPSSCRNGICQCCMLQAMSGSVPPESQRGLKPSLAKQGFLLACACRPTADLVLRSHDSHPTFPSRVVERRLLADDVYQVLLEKPPGFGYAAGQFLQVERISDGLVRPYSLASLPSDEHLELHVRVHETGRMSRWLTSEGEAAVALRGPQGECYYDPKEPERPLLLVGTGTGLSPLLGVLLDALRSGHTGAIELTHGARSVQGLYAWSTLLKLAEAHPNLSLRGLVSEAAAELPPYVERGRIDDSLFSARELLGSAEIYLCGNPGLVRGLKKFAYLNGASLSRIHADPFVVAPGPPFAIGAASERASTSRKGCDNSSTLTNIRS